MARPDARLARAGPLVSAAAIGIERTTGAAALTLDELGRFVQHAMRAGAPGDTPILGRVDRRGRVQQVRLELDMGDDELCALADRLG